MKTFTYTIKDELGIHARPAGLLVKEVQKYECSIQIAKGDKTAMAKQLLKVMALGVKNGDTVSIQAEGKDEEEAIIKLQEFFENNL